MKSSVAQMLCMRVWKVQAISPGALLVIAGEANKLGMRGV